MTILFAFSYLDAELDFWLSVNVRGKKLVLQIQKWQIGSYINLCAAQILRMKADNHRRDLICLVILYLSIVHHFSRLCMYTYIFNKIHFLILQF